jgi:hypothetical protein
MRATKMGIKVAIPGRVVTFNAANQTAKISTEILTVQTEPITGVDLPQPPLVIDQVPVMFPSNGAGAYLTFPIVNGVTTGELLVNDRSIGRWLNLGTPTDPALHGLHKLEDSVFIPGLNPKTNPITPFDSTGAVLEAALVKLGVGATQAAVLGTAFLTLFNAHVHPDPLSGTTGVPTVPMVAGTHTSTKVKIG